LSQSHYAQGTAFERKVIADLAGAGYVTVRAAGSKGGGKVDVIAVHPVGPQLWIQCKRTGAIPPGEWNRLRECAGWAGAVPILAENGPHGRGVTYWRLVADKIPRSRSYPRELYSIRVSGTLVETVDH
jgi:Holliday junction resolvase